MRPACVVLALVLLAAYTGFGVAQQSAPAGSVQPTEAAPKPTKLIDMIPSTLSAESEYDSEPSLAADLSDPRRMVASAFTPNPDQAHSDRAPIYVSDDGGDTWRLELIIPSELMTSDITVSGSGLARRLHAGILKRPSNNTTLSILRDNNFLDSAAPMSEQTTRNNVDQPFVNVHRANGKDRVYIGSNDLGFGSRSAVVDMSTDDGVTYRRVSLEERSTSGQNGPSVRPVAAAQDDIVYIAYFGWRAFTNNIITSDVVVVRDDNGGAGQLPFHALLDPNDSKMGRIVASGLTIPWSNDYALGCERIGSSLSLAVDPTNSSVLYIAWGDRVGNGDIYSIHIRRSLDKGATWSSDLRSIRNASPFSLAIAANGTVGLLYQEYVETGASKRWRTHLLQTRDGFNTTADTTLADVQDGAPPCGMLPYNGDYNGLVAVGPEFRGVFSTSNEPKKTNFPSSLPKYQRLVDFDQGRLFDADGGAVDISIDPFYFAVPALR